MMTEMILHPFCGPAPHPTWHGCGRKASRCEPIERAAGPICCESGARRAADTRAAADAASYAADTRAAARRGELRSVSGTRRAAGQASRVADTAHIGAHAPRKIHRRCIFYSRAHASTHTRTSAHAPRKKYQRYFFYSRVRVTRAPARSRVRRYCARVRATNGRGEPKSCLVFVRIFMTSFRADAPVKVQYYCSNFCTI